MVLNIGRLRSGDFDYVEIDFIAVVDVARLDLVKVKVILETAYLNEDLKRRACRIAEAAGADFVKTSTGFAAGGATLFDLRLMRETVGPKVQIKAAGGVRSLDRALAVRQVGATRLGATATRQILDEAKIRAGAGALRMNSEETF
jgi:deoxyribose-phosphate aldolase